jgi:hypothetical protein
MQISEALNRIGKGSLINGGVFSADTVADCTVIYCSK